MCFWFSLILIVIQPSLVGSFGLRTVHYVQVSASESDNREACLSYEECVEAELLGLIVFAVMFL